MQAIARGAKPLQANEWVEVRRAGSVLYIGTVTNAQLFHGASFTLKEYVRTETNSLTPTCETYTYDPTSTDEIVRVACYKQHQTWNYNGPLGTREDTHALTISTSATLESERAISLHSAKAHDYYAILVSEKFSPPTALSPGGIWRSLVEGSTDEERRCDMKRTLANTKSQWLTRRQQQTLYMTAVDAIPVGYKVGCYKCATCDGYLDAQHLLMDCPAALAAWKLIITAWCKLVPNQDTWAEVLLESDIISDECARAIILGSRPLPFDQHDEQWQAVRATAIEAIIKQHRDNEARAAEGHQLHSPKEAANAAYDECARTVQNIVTHSHKAVKDRMQRNYARPHCVDPADARNPVDAWHAAWIETGMVDQKTLQQIILPPRNANATHGSKPKPKAAPPPAKLPARARVAYTDGSGPETRTDDTAGWGISIVTGGDGGDDEHATEVYSACGKVITDQQQPNYRGATRGTNNTAELCAIAQALEYLIAGKAEAPAVIRYDSIYAGNMAAGKWRARKNKALVAHVRELWNRAHVHLGGDLWASHVRGHSGHKWNTRADELAELGKGDAPTRDENG